MIHVSIYYSPKQGSLESETVLLSEQASVLSVIQASDLYRRFPKLLMNTTVAIFSEQVTLNTLVSAGDRIEICRPLLLDPKEARRVRAKKTS